MSPKFGLGVAAAKLRVEISPKFGLASRRVLLLNHSARA
jgi:hypothetical protein